MFTLRIFAVYWTHFTCVKRVQLRGDYSSKYACIDSSKKYASVQTACIFYARLKKMCRVNHYVHQ